MIIDLNKPGALTLESVAGLLASASDRTNTQLRVTVMGRPKVAVSRVLAASQGWLDSQSPLPEDAAIATVLGTPRRAASTISTVEPYRAEVEQWVAQGVVIFIGDAPSRLSGR